MPLLDIAPIPLGVGITSALLLTWAGARQLNNIIVDQTTCLPDLENLGKPTKTKYAGRVVVCGGAYGGLTFAKMVTEHFDEVIVVESEPTFEDGSRKGVNLMQQNHLHAFGTIVLNTWRRLWDDVDEQIRLADGRITICDNKYYLGARVDVPDDHPHEWIAFCRPTAEAMLRRMTRREPQITFIDGFVTGLVAGDSNSVKGVTYRPTGSDTEIQLDAALVIDATGLACRGAKWIEQLGYTPPRRDFYDPRGAYTTAVVQLTPEVIAKIPWPESYEKIAWIGTAPGEAGYNTRSTYITRWDGDRIAFLQSVYNDVEPTPSTRLEVYEWARGCTMEPWNYELLDILQSEVDEMEIYRCRLGQFYHQRYDLLDRLPGNFVPIGDAVMKLNPIYGQGGSKVGVDVCTLDGVLRRGRKGLNAHEPLPSNLSKTFLAKQTPRAVVTMDFNKALDYAWGNTTLVPGDKGNEGAFLVAWWKQVAQAMMSSRKVTGIVQEILQGMAPPSKLFAPPVLWAVLLTKLGVVSPKMDADMAKRA